MSAYIKGVGIVSPQNTFNSSDFLNEIVLSNANLLRCIEPDYKVFLNPNVARRMGKVMKIGLAAALKSLKDAGTEMPDAIITGSGIGCMEDTEKFLISLIANQEQFLTPTSFIQSTHNTVSAQIALYLKCTNYNFTYVHKGFSFESAVLDGLMTLNESKKNQNILVGGHDEMTDNFFKITERVDYWKKENCATFDLLNSNTMGSIAGEGAAFFVIGNTSSDNDYAELKGVSTIYKPENNLEIESEILSFLHLHNLNINDVDAVIYGIGGDSRYDGIYYSIKNKFFSNANSTYYKHLCGEYQTSSSFALWIAAQILKTQSIPDCVLIGEKNNKPVKNLLIYNNYQNENHSLFLLSGL